MLSKQEYYYSSVLFLIIKRLSYLLLHMQNNFTYPCKSTASEKGSELTSTEMGRARRRHCLWGGSRRWRVEQPDLSAFTCWDRGEVETCASAVGGKQCRTTSHRSTSVQGVGSLSDAADDSLETRKLLCAACIDRDRTNFLKSPLKETTRPPRFSRVRAQLQRGSVNCQVHWASELQSYD